MRVWVRFWCEGCGQFADSDYIDVDHCCAGCGTKTERVRIVIQDEMADEILRLMGRAADVFFPELGETPREFFLREFPRFRSYEEAKRIAEDRALQAAIAAHKHTHLNPPTDLDEPISHRAMRAAIRAAMEVQP